MNKVIQKKGDSRVISPFTEGSNPTPCSNVIKTVGGRDE